jgi:hypothetical protein
VATSDSSHDNTRALLSETNVHLFVSAYVSANVSVKVPIVASASRREQAHWKRALRFPGASEASALSLTAMRPGEPHMEPDPLDLPTSPTLQPVPPPLPTWPDGSGNQPPRRRPPWPLIGVIAGGVAALVIIALLVGLLLRGGTTTVLLGAASDQTATVDSALATSTAEGTPAPTTTTTRGTPAPHGTATPKLPPSVHIVGKSVAGKSNTPLTVTCPSGELALSGGWSSSVRNSPITFSKRSGNGWQILINTLNTGLIPTTTVYAICLQHVAGASVTERQATVTVAYGLGEEVRAMCNSGEIDVGGGGENNFGGYTYELQPSISPVGFFAGIYNITTSQQPITAYAECLRATGAQISLTQPAAETYVNSGASAGLQATCSGGALVAGGGVNFSSKGVYDYSPSNSSTWQAHVTDLESIRTDFTLQALCLSFS